MLIAALLLSALASPTEPPARTADAITVRTWYKVDGPPARPMWLNRRGRFTCATWPDGIAARCTERTKEGGEELSLYDPRGLPSVQISLTDGAPSSAEVHRSPLVTLDLSDWGPRSIGKLEIRLPPGEQVSASESELTWLAEELRIDLRVLPLPKAEVLTLDYASSLSSATGAEILDRAVSFLGEHRGERTRLHLAHPTAPTWIEVWAFPVEDDLIVLTSTAAAGAERELAMGRVIAALLTAKVEP